MPIMYDIIPEVYEHVIDPITKQLVDKFLKENRLKNVFGDNIYYFTDASSASTSSDKNRNVKLRNNKLNVTINPIFDPEDGKWKTTNFKNTPSSGISKSFVQQDFPIFADGESDIALYSQMMPTTINLAMELFFSDKIVAHTTLDSLYNSYGPYPLIDSNSVLYSMPIPGHLLILLYSLYRMSRYKEEMSFPEYLTRGSNEDITFAKNRIGNDTEIVVVKNDFHVLSEINLTSRKSTTTKIGQYAKNFVLELELTYQISRPNSFILMYPTVVNNQPISGNLVPKLDDGHVDRNQVVRTERALQDYYTFNIRDPRYPDLIYKTDQAEDWVIPKSHHHAVGYKDFYLGTFTLDEDPGPAYPDNLPDLYNKNIDTLDNIDDGTQFVKMSLAERVKLDIALTRDDRLITDPGTIDDLQ